MCPVNDDGAEEGMRLAEALRGLAWTVHNSVPDRAGIQPVPRTELTILKQVLEQPGATVGELARAVGMRQPNASAALRRLLERSLVTAQKSETDRRVSRIYPSDRSRSEHRAIVETWSGSLGAAFAALAPAHQQALRAATEALAALDVELQAIDRARGSSDRQPTRGDDRAAS